jgi:hypothetical protein
VIVTGSRDWVGAYAADRIHRVLDAVHNLALRLGQPLTIIHGDGPGADQTIDAWAVRREDLDVTVERYPPAWNPLGRAAGPIRNRAMIQAGADMCIGFLKDASKGTTGTLMLADGAGIPTYTVNWEDPA